MRWLAWALLGFLLGGAVTASPQSLVEVAAKERQRRQKLKGQPDSSNKARGLEKTRRSTSRVSTSTHTQAKTQAQTRQAPPQTIEATRPTGDAPSPSGSTGKALHVEKADNEEDPEPETLRVAEAATRTSTAVLPSLVEIATQEKDRRKTLPPAPKLTFDERHLSRVHFGRPLVSEREAALLEASAQPPGGSRDPGFGEDDRSATPSLGLASLAEETAPGSGDVEFRRAGGGSPTTDVGGSRITSTGESFRMPHTPSRSGFLRGTVYADWFRAVYSGGASTGQLSNRLRLEVGAAPGEGWRGFVDARDRFNNGAGATNALVVYDARLIYENRNHPMELSVGQMNLYNSAGVGQLLGGVVGFRLGSAWTVGGYGGLEPDIYSIKFDTRYHKYGFYTQFHGSRAKSAALSYNTIRFNGETEREFVYGSGLVPLGDFAVLYGNMEYELGDNLGKEDRLSHLFLNARYNITRAVDVSAHYSSGRGLDFHRFLVEQSQNPDRNSAELERFYYSKTYGARLSVKPHRRLRLYVAQRESEQKDRLIRNHTTQIGASAQNVVGTGVSVYGSYNINRGDASESDSYRISLSRDFGPLSWTGYYSTTFNGIRFDATTGLPEIIRISDRRTISNDLFFSVTRALALSVEHDYSNQGEGDENSLFFRVIYRF